MLLNGNGIPAADLKEHERQKQGSQDSDDDEPLPKRPKPEGLLGSAPSPMPSPAMVQGLMPQAVHPGMPPGMHMGQMLGHMGHLGPHFMAPGMHMMPPHLAMMQAQANSAAKPLFPSAVPVSSPGTPVVGADFKPITAGSPTTKPTFPAYTGATISAPPTTNNTPTSSSNSGENCKIGTIATTGAASKIIHPIDDISLEEIRARHSKYQRGIPPKDDDVASTSTAASEQLAMAVSAAQQAAVQQAKQEAYNHAAMLQRFQRPPMMAMPGTPVTSMPLVMRPTMLPGHPTFVGANLMRPPPLGMPPGLIGMPPGVVYGGPVLPGGHMLTPMMQPRYR